MTAQQHSLALPLRIVPQKEYDSAIVDIVEANGRLVCPCDEYDAQELVRCVNSFRDLLKACKNLMATCTLNEHANAMQAAAEAIRNAEL
jgi:hypothetical protein